VKNHVNRAIHYDVRAIHIPQSVVRIIGNGDIPQSIIRCRNWIGVSSKPLNWKGTTLRFKSWSGMLHSATSKSWLFRWDRWSCNLAKEGSSEIRVFHDLQTHLICISVLTGRRERMSAMSSSRRAIRDVGVAFECTDFAGG
jgi:hypothetical protein